MANDETSLGEEILRASSAISEGSMDGENMQLAKQQLIAAYGSFESRNIERTADHLCLAVSALIQELATLNESSASRQGRVNPTPLP